MNAAVRSSGQRASTFTKYRTSWWIIPRIVYRLEWLSIIRKLNNFPWAASTHRNPDRHLPGFPIVPQAVWDRRHLDRLSRRCGPIQAVVPIRIRRGGP
jgi:hypothetical protein